MVKVHYGYGIRHIPSSFPNEPISCGLIDNISCAYKLNLSFSVKHFQNHFSHLLLVKVFETENCSRGTETLQM